MNCRRKLKQWRGNIECCCLFSWRDVYGKIADEGEGFPLGNKGRRLNPRKRKFWERKKSKE